MKTVIISSDATQIESETGNPIPTSNADCARCGKYGKSETGFPESFYYYNTHIVDIKEKIARVTSDVSHINDRIAAVEDKKSKNEFSRPEKISIFVAILALIVSALSVIIPIFLK